MVVVKLYRFLNGLGDGRIRNSI